MLKFRFLTNVQDTSFRLLAYYVNDIIYGISYTRYRMIYGSVYMQFCKITFFFVDELKKATFNENSMLFSDVGKFKKDDVRRSLIFIFFILMAFFGCGNVANLNSFSPSSIIPFVHVFNPFLMGFLLFFKVILPFLPVCVAFLIIIR